MDLRGLENIQWRGFSDKEIQQLHQHNISKPVAVKVSRAQQYVDAPKLDEVEDQKDSHHSCDIERDQVDQERQNRSETKETSLAGQTPPGPRDYKETADVTVDIAQSELDPEKQQTAASLTADQQLMQKLMEEENKRRKTLIEQTLQDRAHQQQLETKMLMSVKIGLKELEKIVSKDVKILRDKIEETDRFYNIAKKRFECAEAEYIAAKMELFKWSEQKELLSEHLCAVIQQNESRKAVKLSELLKSLQLEEPDHDDQITNS